MSRVTVQSPMAEAPKEKRSRQEPLHSKSLVANNTTLVKLQEVDGMASGTGDEDQIGRTQGISSKLMS